MTDRTDEIRQRCDAGRTVRITDVKYLLSEVDLLNCKLQDERKEHSEEYARLRSTYIGKAKELTAEVDRLNALHKREIIITGEYAQRVIDLTARAEAAEARADAAVEDLKIFSACCQCDANVDGSCCDMFDGNAENKYFCSNWQWRGPQAGKGNDNG